jgi:beta-glucosidase
MTDLKSVAALAARFPQHFVWGVASSAFQIEGAAASDGKGASIWDEFCRVPGAIADGTDGQIACDHYHRLDADLDLIAALGVKAYRFSISWPRVQPTGSGPIAPAGLDFYQRLVDGLLKRDIQAYATLYHWDLPAALQQQHQGWAGRDTAYRFAEYAQVIAQSLGDRLTSIATHNEPWVTATLGHELGIFAPGLKDRRVAMQVSHHCLLSHGLAQQAMRSVKPKLDVGIVLNLSPVYAASPSAADQSLAVREDGLLVRWYMDAIFKGAYPDDVLAFLGKDAPQVRPGDAELICQPLDFLGVNYYHPIISTDSRPFSPTREGVPVTDMGWEVAPPSFTELLLRLNRDYELPPLYITENGAAYRDLVVEGGVRDEERRAYIESHVRAMADAADQGVDVRGYFVWSLLDNFEWAAGYTKRFGIYYVDYETQARILKRSGFWFKHLATAFRQGRPNTAQSVALRPQG